MDFYGGNVWNGGGNDSVFELEGSGFNVSGNGRDVCRIPNGVVADIQGDVSDFHHSFDRRPAGVG